MKEHEDRELQYLRNYREVLFSGRNHNASVLTGRLQLSVDETVFDDMWDEQIILSMSFGQFISFTARHRGFQITALAQAIQCSIDEIERLYDDDLFPWDLRVDFMMELHYVLDIKFEELCSIIEHHPLDEELLEKRISNAPIAARSHHTLDRKEREKALLEAQLKIQSHRENKKRRKFLDELLSCR